MWQADSMLFTVLALFGGSIFTLAGSLIGHYRSQQQADELGAKLEHRCVFLCTAVDRAQAEFGYAYTYIFADWCLRVFQKFLVRQLLPRSHGIMISRRLS